VQAAYPALKFCGGDLFWREPLSKPGDDLGYPLILRQDGDELARRSGSVRRSAYARPPLMAESRVEGGKPFEEPVAFDPVFV